MARALLLVTYGVLALGLALLWYQAPGLPEQLATSFDHAGRPRGTSPRVSALVGLAGAQVLPVLAMLMLPLLLRRLPDSLINLPHREYWLAAPRREATLAYVEAWLAAAALAMALFFGANGQLILAANRAPEPRLGAGFWGLVAGALLTTTLGIVALYRRFRAPR